MKVNLPLQISDQLIGLDKDNFVRIDRVETMLTPLFTSRRCDHHPLPRNSDQGPARCAKGRRAPGGVLIYRSEHFEDNHPATLQSSCEGFETT